MFCRNCGHEINELDKFCSNCGVSNPIGKEEGKIPEKTLDEKTLSETIRISVSPSKNPGLAAIASFFVPGLGQIYNGEIITGATFLFSELLLIWVGISLINTSQMLIGLELIIGILLIGIGIVFWIYNIHHAYRMSEKIASQGQK